MGENVNQSEGGNMKQGIRTDLAVEIRESIEQEGEIPGVEWQMEEDAGSGARISKVVLIIPSNLFTVVDNICNINPIPKLFFYFFHFTLVCKCFFHFSNSLLSCLSIGNKLEHSCIIFYVFSNH